MSSPLEEFGQGRRIGLLFDVILCPLKSEIGVFWYGMNCAKRKDPYMDKKDGCSDGIVIDTRNKTLLICFFIFIIFDTRLRVQDMTFVTGNGLWVS